MSIPLPLAVRLVTSRQDRHVTKDLRDLSFRSVIPGGFASCTISLDRPLIVQPAEVSHYGQLYVYDTRTGETVWEGRVEDLGRGADENGQVWDLAAVGPSAYASDRAVPMVYVDTTLDHFYKTKGSQKAYTVEQGAIPTDDKIQGWVCHMPRGTTSGGGKFVGILSPRVRECGQKLARVTFSRLSGTGSTTANWNVRAQAYDSADRMNQFISEAMATTAASRSGVVITNWANGRDMLLLALQNVAADAAVGNDLVWTQFYDIKVRTMLVNETGSEITTGYTLDTVYAHEVVKDLLGRLLDRYDGKNATIETGNYTIQQLAYPDGATPAQVLTDLMALEASNTPLRGIEGGFYWAAWESAPADAVETYTGVVSDDEDASFGGPGDTGTVGYPIVVPQGTTTLTIDLVGAVGDDLDLYLYKDGVQVDSSLGGGSTEQIIRTNPAPGTYEVWIHGFAVVAGGAFTLSYEIEPTPRRLHRFEWKKWPSTVRYQASIRDGFDSPGSAADMYNRVLVRFKDSAGAIRLEERTQQVDALDDAGLLRQAYIDLGDQMGTRDNAAQVGDRFLTEHSVPPNSGNLAIAGPIDDLAAGRRAWPWQIRPGALIRVRGVSPSVDSLNRTGRDGATVFRIVGVEFRASTGTVLLELDSSPLSIAHGVGDLVKKPAIARWGTSTLLTRR